MTKKENLQIAEEQFNAVFPRISGSRYRRAYCCMCHDAMRVSDVAARRAYENGCGSMGIFKKDGISVVRLACDDCLRSGEVDFEKACANARALTQRQREKKV